MNEYTQNLLFNEEKHRYSIKGITVPSVTEVISPLTYSKYSVSNNVLEQAALRGSMVHELTASLDLGILGDEDPIDISFAPYLQAWKAFCHDYSPEFEFVELPLAGESFEGYVFSGTIDRVCNIDGKRVVLDIKTYGGSMTREQKIATACQLQGYNTLARENSIYTDIRYARYVHLKKDGTYDTKTVEEIDKAYGFPGSNTDSPTFYAFNYCLRLAKYAKGYKI